MASSSPSSSLLPDPFSSPHLHTYYLGNAVFKSHLSFNSKVCRTARRHQRRWRMMSVMEFGEQAGVQESRSQQRCRSSVFGDLSVRHRISEYTPDLQSSRGSFDLSSRACSSGKLPIGSRSLVWDQRSNRVFSGFCRFCLAYFA